jgi:hypothetical protein
MNKEELWETFVKNHRILNFPVPLFKCHDLIVETIERGIEKKSFLKRSPEMEYLLISEVNKVINDFNQNSEIYDGLIYMMYKIRDNKVIPLYIGKSEKYGKKDKNLSVNIKNIEKNNDKFCRWGYNYAYHTGDLSAVTCLGHNQEKINKKYHKWAASLFQNFPSEQPRLKEMVYFWIKAWDKNDFNILKEYGPIKVTFLEYLLIGIASELFPRELLNDEGVNR